MHTNVVLFCFPPVPYSLPRLVYHSLSLFLARGNYPDGERIRSLRGQRRRLPLGREFAGDDNARFVQGENRDPRTAQAEWKRRRIIVANRSNGILSLSLYGG